MQSGNGMSLRYLADGRRIETSSSTVGTPLILPPPPPLGSPAPPVEYLFTDTEMSFGPLTWRNGILTRYDFPGGFFSLYDDENDHQPKTSIHDRDLEILRTKIKKQKRATKIENITDRPIPTNVKNNKSEGY